MSERLNTDAFDVDWSDREWRWYSWELDTAVQAGYQFGLRWRKLLTEYGVSLDCAESLLDGVIDELTYDISLNANLHRTAMEREVFATAAITLNPAKVGRDCDPYVRQYAGVRQDVY